MGIYQEGGTPPKPEKKPSLEDGVWLSVRTDKVKVREVGEGHLKVEIKEEDESVYVKDGALHINV